MYDLQSFGLRQMIEASRAIRLLGVTASSMENAANDVVSFLYHHLRTSDGLPACALVRCFKTENFGKLPTALQQMASDAIGHPLNSSSQCLALLATRGQQPGWNDRHDSSGHQAIPLASPSMVARAPMIAKLIQQMGLNALDVVDNDTRIPEEVDRKTLEVFFIGQARGSPFIPAQEGFVLRYDIKSVLGFGGILSNGAFFFVILFTVIPICPATAEMFRTFALGVKLVMLAQVDKPVFNVTGHES